MTVAVKRMKRRRFLQGKSGGERYVDVGGEDEQFSTPCKVDHMPVADWLSPLDEANIVSNRCCWVSQRAEQFDIPDCGMTRLRR